MRRIKLYTSIILIIFVLTACTGNEVSQTTEAADPQTFTVENENFRVKTTINKLTFKKDEEINIYSTIEYIGNNESISVWSGDPYFHHTIFKNQVCINGEITHTILKKTVLKKGEVVKIPFLKNGAFDENDSNAEFLKKYLAEKELKLPEGEYTFTARTAFTMDQDQKEKVLLKNEFIVKVK